jgi:hypothetical protein
LALIHPASPSSSSSLHLSSLHSAPLSSPSSQLNGQILPRAARKSSTPKVQSSQRISNVVTSPKCVYSMFLTSDLQKCDRSSHQCENLLRVLCQLCTLLVRFSWVCWSVCLIVHAIMSAVRDEWERKVRSHTSGKKKSFSRIISDAGSANNSSGSLYQNCCSSEQYAHMGVIFPRDRVMGPQTSVEFQILDKKKRQFFFWALKNP